MNYEINKKILTSIKIFFFLNLTISKKIDKSHDFKICNNISLLIKDGLWNFFSKNKPEKIERNLIIPLIFLHHLQPLHIVTNS